MGGTMLQIAIRMLFHKRGRFLVTAAGMVSLFLLSTCQLGMLVGWCNTVSALILRSEADVWVVRANAYTQAALAELMRTRGIDLANQSKNSKLATFDNTNNNGLINGALTNR